MSGRTLTVLAIGGVLFALWLTLAATRTPYFVRLAELLPAAFNFQPNGEKTSGEKTSDANDAKRAITQENGHSTVSLKPSASEPILKIETGYHAAVVNKLSLTRNGQVLSVSDDKTGRLWEGINHPGKILRVPIGQQSEGALYAVAASPLKDMAVVGGSTGFTWDNAGTVYSFDLNTGELIGRIPGIPGTINVLSYSKNGRYLAIGTGTGLLRVIDLQTKANATQNNDCPTATTAIEFLTDDRLITACLDGKIRLYDQHFNLIALFQLANGQRPWRLAVSPDESQVAVGTLDASDLYVLNVAGLAQAKILAPKLKKSGAFPSVAWGNSGIFAAGTYGDNSGQKLIHHWNLETGQQTDFPISKDSITDLIFTKPKELAFATAEATIGHIDLDTSQVTTQPRLIPDYRDAYQGRFALSKDGTVIEIGRSHGGLNPIHFSFQERKLMDQANPDTSLFAPILPASAKDWRNSTQLKIDGKKIALAENEIARAIAGSEDNALIALGTDYSLKLFDQGELLWNIPMQSPVWAVNISRDRRFAVAAVGDGTIHWFNLKDASEAMSLFITADNRWIAWTPEGYFDYSTESLNAPVATVASRGIRRVPPQKPASQLIGYHINRGHAVTPQFVFTEQIQHNYFRPDLIFQKFQNDGGNLSVPHQQSVASVLDQHRPPKLQSLAWCNLDSCKNISVEKPQTIKVNTPEITLRYELADQGSGIGDIVLRRSGAAVATRGIKIVQPKPNQALHEQKLSLETGDNPITLSAFDGNEFIESTNNLQLIFHYEGKSPSQPSLYVLSVGINNYQYQAITRLVNAVNDANGMVSLLNQQRRHFKDIITTVLTDGQATRKNIEYSLKQIAEQARPDDRVILFLAGHGFVMDGHFYFLPVELKSPEDAEIKANALADTQLSDLISNISTSRVAVLIDSCYAGSLANPNIVTRRHQEAMWTNALGQNTGRFFLAGSAYDQEALDGKAGHGVFTSVLLDALSGRADQELRGNHDRKVDVVELSEYAKQHVPIEARKIDPMHNQQVTGFFMGSDFFELVSLD